MEPEQRLPGPFPQEEYVGWYRSRAHSWEVEPAGYELEPFRIAPVDHDRFVVLEGWLQGEVLEFCRGDDGSVDWLPGFVRAAKKRS